MGAANQIKITMKIKIIFYCFLLLLAFWLGFYAGSHPSGDCGMRRAECEPAKRTESPSAEGGVEQRMEWSKWSTPYNTAADGWYREHGIIQCRTNLDTGLVEERNVR